ncbi:MAG: TRAP transporter small permease subunit [Rhodospirillales bacterium]|nr:TRAP transporter small permease subunit [Rhodospirillales bacterium]
MNESSAFIMPFWLYWGLIVFVPLIFLVIVKLRANGVRENPFPEPEVPAIEGKGIADTYIRFVEKISAYSGRFIAFWIVITVTYYSYEVVARYGFNAPTNWAHEASFLIFGTMFIMCGAYGYLFKSHVRVDAIYTKLPRQWQLVIDIVTWVLFLLYMIAFMKTAWTFFVQAADSKIFFFGQGSDNETSFSEWRVSYLPIKGCMVLGSIFLTLQGVANVIRDIREFRKLEG